MCVCVCVFVCVCVVCHKVDGMVRKSNSRPKSFSVNQRFIRTFARCGSIIAEILSKQTNRQSISNEIRVDCGRLRKTNMLIHGFVRSWLGTLQRTGTVSRNRKSRESRTGSSYAVDARRRSGNDGLVCVQKEASKKQDDFYDFPIARAREGVRKVALP